MPENGSSASANSTRERSALEVNQLPTSSASAGMALRNRLNVAANNAAKTKLTAAFESYLRSDVPELGLKGTPAPKKEAPKKK